MTITLTTANAVENRRLRQADRPHANGGDVDRRRLAMPIADADRCDVAAFSQQAIPDRDLRFARRFLVLPDLDRVDPSGMMCVHEQPSAIVDRMADREQRPGAMRRVDEAL